MLALVLLLFNSTLTLGSANTLAFGAARLLPWPLILILLAVTIERRTRGLAIGLGMVAVAFAVLVPEASYAVPACGVAVIAHDAYRATWTRTRIRRDFSLTIWSIAGGGVIAAALLVVLVSNHAVGGFLDYYGVVVSGHTLVGGIPLPSWSGATEQLLFWIVAPGVAVLLGAGILALKARLRFALKTTDFLLLASGVFTVLYYGEEFMGRTDPSHGGLAYFAAMPLILLCLWDVTGWLNGWIRTRLGAWRVGKLRWPVMYLAVACAAITASTPLLNALSAAPMDFRASAPTEPLLSSLGYMDYPNQRLYSDIGVFLSAFLKPGEEIYDFSGDPGIYYWILDYRPATTHFTIGEDTTLRQQQDTVTQLEAARPLFAVLSSSMKTSLSVWDGIVNGVREYQIAQYILDHYEPFADVGDQLIYVRDGAAPTIPAGLRAELGAQLTLTDLPFRYPDCAWGYVPEFLDVPPPAGETGVAVGGAAGPSDSWSLSVPPGHTWADYHWIDLAIAPGSQGASFTLDDREVPDEYHDITFQTLPGGQSSYRFPIGACPQWYGYGAADLRLSSSAPVGITQIELLA